MNYAYRYRLHPTEAQRETLDHHLDSCRQIYNHALHELDTIPNSAGTVTQRVNTVIKQLPEMKEWWDELTELYSTVSQDAVKRAANNIIRLSGATQNGQTVGSLNWKSPREYQSVTYVQSDSESE